MDFLLLLRANLVIRMMPVPLKTLVVTVTPFMDFKCGPKVKYKRMRRSINVGITSIMADSDSIFNVDSLTKAAEAFDATPPDSLTAVENLDQDGEKLAEDMYQVFVSFKSSSTQLGKVDSDYSSSWQGRWDPLSEVCFRVSWILHDS